MGDWKLTEFNSRLDSAAGRNPFTHLNNHGRPGGGWRPLAHPLQAPAAQIATYSWLTAPMGDDPPLATLPTLAHNSITESDHDVVSHQAFAEFQVGMSNQAYRFKQDEPRANLRPNLRGGATRNTAQTPAAPMATYSWLTAPIDDDPLPPKLPTLAQMPNPQPEREVWSSGAFLALSAQLTRTTYRHTFDQPRVEPRPDSLWCAGNASATTLGWPEGEPAEYLSGWYQGPQALRPESMRNLLLYYREQPGAWLEKILRPLGGMAAVAGLATAVLALAFLTSNFPFHRGGANSSLAVPANEHVGEIGILNPAWLAYKADRLYLGNDSFGFYDSDSSFAESAGPPSKFIYVPPAQAQEILESLIKQGYLTAAGGPPNVVRDFTKLMRLGITTN